MPDVITYSTAINACEKGQQPRQALELLNQMQHRRLMQDVITYSAAISACEWGQQPQQALQLLNQMQHRDPCRTSSPTPQPSARASSF